MVCMLHFRTDTTSTNAADDTADDAEATDDATVPSQSAQHEVRNTATKHCFVCINACFWNMFRYL